MSIFLTGDIHGDIYPRFNTTKFPWQKFMTKNDYVIVLGDFGIPWNNSKTDNYMLNELKKRPFTTLFIDGNHENFDLLNSYPVETWNGGKVHKLNDSVYHLMRGQVFTLQGKTFFTFGGASSHDISDGVLDPYDDDFAFKVKQLQKQGKYMWRVNHISWWKEELPSDEECEEGMENLRKHDFHVDYILSHTPPTSVFLQIVSGEPDATNKYLQTVKDMTDYKQWYFGHMHTDTSFYADNCFAMYHSIMQVNTNISIHTPHVSYEA